MRHNTLGPIFSSHVNVRIMKGFNEAADTTAAWTTEDDLPDFRETELVSTTGAGRLTKHAPGKVADTVVTGARSESIKVGRFSGQAKIDDMDIINNRFGKRRDLFENLGRSAKRLRPDLVYSLILANPSMKSDGQAVFLESLMTDLLGADSVLSIAAVQKMFNLMASHRQDGAPLSIKPSFLVVPPSLQWIAKQIVKSGTTEATRAGERGTYNTLGDENLQIIPEARIGAGGVKDPDSGTLHQGNDNQWFGVASPSLEGATI